MGSWLQHLFSKRVRDPQTPQMVDGFHILTDEVGDDYRFTENIIRRPDRTEVRRVAFIHDCGDRFYIGMDGRVPDVLGENHPCAYERTIFKTGPSKGRKITFVHGYFAPKGTPIPDLDDLIEQQPKHLGEILQRANAGETPVRIAPASFTRQRVRGTDWDRLATEFEKGAHRMRGATFTEDGKLFRMLDSLESAPQGGEKKKPTAPNTISGINRTTFLQVAAAALLATLGYAAWRILLKSRNADKTTQETAPPR